MRPLPTNKLDPRVKTVWRISDALSIIVFYGLLMAPLAIWHSVDPTASIATTLMVWVTVVAAVFMVVWLTAAEQIRYVRWRYEVGVNELDIAYGIIWRRRIIVPFVRVQDTDTRQGPILRMCGLASVTVSTAAGSHVIPGLPFEEADALRDRIAEQARLAQEDV
jgi:membrane protein YdbS with pleckstrin-like domain